MKRMYLNKRISSFKYAIKGLHLAWNEPNFIIEVYVALLVLLAGLFFHITHEEWLVVILTIGIVLAAELFNTALEALCDMLRPTHDPHVAKIKDLSAGAVLAIGITAWIVGIKIFLPYVLVIVR